MLKVVEKKRKVVIGGVGAGPKGTRGDGRSRNGWEVGGELGQAQSSLRVRLGSGFSKSPTQSHSLGLGVGAALVQALILGHTTRWSSVV